MTLEEAIRTIKAARAEVEWTYPMDYATAFDMAISALQAQELSETQKALDTIGRQTAKPRYIDANEIPYCEVLDADTHKGTGRFMADKKDIDALPSAQPERTEHILDTKAVRSKRGCVDLAERVDATFYDQEHEEWTQKTVTIADVLDSVCDEYTILPPAQPYTDEEIQKMQDLEQAQLDKAYELGRQSAQSEQSTEIQEILDYLDNTLHPIVSPDNWNVYSELYDMISSLSSVQPEPCEDTSCPYCHEDSDGYVTPLEKNCHAFIRFGMNGWCLNLQANKWHGEVKINYCPMCGRKF